MRRFILTVVTLVFVPVALAVGGLWLIPERIWPAWEAATRQLQKLVTDGATAYPQAQRQRRLAALAVTAQEDERLYARQVLGLYLPVDLQACARAALHNLSAGSLLEGCSTVQMALAKFAIPEDQRYERTWSRKLLQVRLAANLVGVPPQQVLSSFLETLPCASDLAQGLEACGLLYFGHPVEELLDSEVILLATAIQAPGRDLRDAGRAHARLRRILTRLVALGWIGAPEAERVLAAPPRLGRLHPDLVRAERAGRGLPLTRALEHAVSVAREDLRTRGLSTDHLVVLGAIWDADARLVAQAGGSPAWLQRPFELGSWVKPFCAQTLLEQAGPDYLIRTSIPLRLPLRDRQLRPYHPDNASHHLPSRDVPINWVLRSANTATLASLLYVYLYLPPARVDALLSTHLTGKERTRYRSSRDQGLSQELASAYSGYALQAADVPDLPGYREITTLATRSCLAQMRSAMAHLEVPHEDLAALLGVVRAPLTEIGPAMMRLWLRSDRTLTPLGHLFAAHAGEGTLRSLTSRLGTAVPYKTATATRNVGLLIMLPPSASPGGEAAVLMLAATRTDGAPIHPLQGAQLGAGVIALLDAMKGSNLAGPLTLNR